MKKTILTLALMAFSTMLFAQNNPVDFEEGGIGADWSWTVFENGENPPPVDVILNPDASGINTSDSVASITSKAAGASFAGATSRNIGDFTLDATNRTITLMVWKTKISDVGLKLETASGFAFPEVKVANTVTNEWEELTFDFSGVGNPPDEPWNGITIFPDFGERSEDHTTYFDNLTFSEEMDTGGGTVVEFCAETVYNNGDSNTAASAAVLTIANEDAQSMRVTMQSGTASPLDVLIANAFNGPITGSPAVSAVDTLEDGSLTLLLTWNGTPPAEVDMNVLWSHEDFEGNWQLNTENTTVSFTQMCGDTGGPQPGEELLANGDFEGETADPWFVNFGDGSVPLQEAGGNTFLFVDVETAGDAFAVNLSQQVAIAQGETYTLEFDASSSGNGRTMLAGIGLNEAPFTNNSQTINLTSSSQTFSLDLTATDFGIPNSRVLFDMGADTGIVVIDNVSLSIKGETGTDMPMVAAPTPTKNQADVISLFSSAYNDVPVDTWSAGFSDVTFTDSVDIEGTPVKKYSALNFVGIETVSNQLDITTMTDFSIDVWSADFTSFSVKLVDFGADGAFDGGDDTEHQVDFSMPNQSEWVTFDIPLEDFTGLTTKSNIAQFILVGQPTGATTIFVDNMYFYDDMGTSIDDENVLPSEFALNQNYPNPFNPSTNISYNLPSSGEITLEVFNIQGQRVATLENGFKTAGSYTVTFDASHLASGVYTYRLVSENSVKVKKMLLIK